MGQNIKLFWMDSANAFSSLHLSCIPVGKKTNKEDSQADATAAGKQSLFSQNITHAQHALNNAGAYKLTDAF